MRTTNPRTGPKRSVNGDIPYLPDAWLKQLQAEQWQERNVNNHASIAEVVAWLEGVKGYADAPCALMGRALDATLEQQEEGEEAQHDIMNRRVIYHINLAFEGHVGVGRALEEVKNKHVEMVFNRRVDTNDTSLVRSPAEAEAEFLRSRDGAIRIFMMQDEEELDGCACLAEPERPEDENAPGFYAEYKEPGRYRDTDKGLAEHFADIHKWDFAWLTEEEQWILWNGNTWRRDQDLQIQRMAQGVGDRLFDAVDALWETHERVTAMGGPTEELQTQIKHLTGRAKEAHQLPRIKRLIEMSRSLPKVARSLSEFDADAHALGVQNGVVILGADGSVNLRAGTRGDRITRSTRVPYEPGAKSKELSAYFRMFVPDTSIRHFLQKFLGYSLLGNNKERRIAFFIGETSTGKSTLMEAVIAMMGDYGGPLPLSIFRANNEDKPRPDIIAAKPRRIISTSELDEKTPIHADQLKKLISVDSIAVRGMRKDDFDERPPAFTPYIASNQTPTVPGADAAFRKRLVVFPFNHSVAGSVKDDKSVTERFKTDLDVQTALLAWMVEGYDLYCAEGLDDMPKAMRDEQDSFMSGTGHVQQWFIETFVKDARAEECTEAIGNSYETWCEENDVPRGERLNKGRALPHFLQDAGFKKVAGTRRVEKEVRRFRAGFRFRSKKEKRSLQ